MKPVLILAALGALFLTHEAAARETFVDRQTPAIFSGSYRIDFSTGVPPLVGELVDCTTEAVPGPILESRLTYLAFPGVCDDFSDRPCNGRLVAIFERCLSTEISLTETAIAGGYTVSQLRICFDPLADPDLGIDANCTSAEAVAHGASRGIGRAEAEGASGEAQSVLSIDESRWFRIDERWTRVRRLPFNTDSLFERDPSGPESCVVQADGCEIQGIGRY
ncbi:MAG: hypothetical protein AAGE43_09800 [Pseudomonadota bacterium]